MLETGFHLLMHGYVFVSNLEQNVVLLRVIKLYITHIKPKGKKKKLTHVDAWTHLSSKSKILCRRGEV